MSKCLPPDGTKPNTRHVLKGGSKELEFEWTGTGWSSPGTGFQTKPSAMNTLGWKYERPLGPRVVMTEIDIARLCGGRQ